MANPRFGTGLPAAPAYIGEIFVELATNTVYIGNAARGWSVANVNSGTVAGRAGVPILIGQSTLAAATGYTSPSFVAESYQEIGMEIDGLETSAAFDPILNLTGAGPTAGAVSGVYRVAGSQTIFDNVATMYLATLDSAGGNISVHGRVAIYPLVTGRLRHYSSEWHSSGVIRTSTAWGQCTDTTNGITAVGWTGSTSFTGTVRVWGVPA